MTDPFLNKKNEEEDDFFEEVEGTASSIEDDDFFSLEDMAEAPPEPPREYRMPDNGAWVPLRIKESTIRNPKTDADNSLPFNPPWQYPTKVFVGFDGAGNKSATFQGIQKLSSNDGFREEVRSLSIDWFDVQLNHVAERYGVRMFDYSFSAPVHTVKQEKRSGGSWCNDHGYKLRTAAGISLSGRNFGDKSLLSEIAKEMEGAIVMAQVEVYQKSSGETSDPVKDEQGNPIGVKIDPDSGTPVIVTETSPGNYTVKGTGEKTPGIERGDLFPVGVPGEYYIIDPNGSAVMQPRIRYQDRLKFGAIKPVPGAILPEDQVTDEMRASYVIRTTGVPEGKVCVERMARVNRKGGTTVTGTITWDTIGDVLADGGRYLPGQTRMTVLTDSGELIPAVWMGTGWMEDRRAETTESEGVPF